MAVIDPHTEILVMDSVEKLTLREERKRTGRYVALGAAIFLSILGLYQVVSRGLPQYAVLFAPALIMFIYILWILHVSKHQLRSAKDKELTSGEQDLPNWNIKEANKSECIEKNEKNKNFKEGHTFSRSYSIA